MNQTASPTLARPAPTGPASDALDPLKAALPQWPLATLLQEAQRLQDAGQPTAAAGLYAAWLEANPQSPLRHVAAFNLGTVLAAQGRDSEAEAAYLQALASQPHFPQARLNLGHALERRGQGEEALAQWQQVVQQTRGAGAEHEPLCLHALNNRARLLEQLRRYEESAECLAESLRIRPAQFDVLQHHVHLRQKRCEWPVWQGVGEVTANQLLVGTSPLAMLGLTDDPGLQLMAAQRFVHERVMRPPAQPLHASVPHPPREGRIRIGYLSGDLCMHAVGLLSVELLELHDRSRFEVHGLSWSREDGSPLRQRLLAAMDHHLPLHGLDDAEAARRIAALGLDLIVDLQGLTQGARPNILVQRPAPAQISYLGLPGTCALPGVDWIVADPWVMPPALEPFHTERPLRVPVCYQVSDRQREVAPECPPRAAHGLPEDAFVYCSFNNTFKFTEPMFALWMRVLRAVPGSVLWLLADNDWARANLQRQAQAQGVDPARLVFAPRVAPPDYLARFTRADLMLDTFPYNAGTTASDALWMGLPILTCSGRTYISRMAGSLLHAAGLPDLVTTDLAEYERLAILYGQQPRRLASLRRYLGETVRHSPLFDLPARVRDLEQAFTTLALAGRARASATAPGSPA